MSKVEAALKKAIESKDAARVGTLVDFLRFKYGFKYNGLLDLAMQLVPSLTPQEWDDLLYEADEGESDGDPTCDICGSTKDVRVQVGMQWPEDVVCICTKCERSDG